MGIVFAWSGACGKCTPARICMGGIAYLIWAHLHTYMCTKTHSLGIVGCTQSKLKNRMDGNEINLEI